MLIRLVKDKINDELSYYIKVIQKYKYTLTKYLFKVYF